MVRLSCLAALALCLVPGYSSAQKVNKDKEEAVVIFKDGFFVRGWPVQAQEFIYDPIGGSFRIPNTHQPLFLDDLVRRIRFGSGQVQEVLSVKKAQRPVVMELRRNPSPKRQEAMPGNWQFEAVSDWDEKWERTITVKTASARSQIKQRIILLTPLIMRAQTIGFDWDFGEMTHELGKPVVVKLLADHFKNDKELKLHERRIKAANFLQQAGWYKEAEDELKAVIEDYPDFKKVAEEKIQELRKPQSEALVEELEQVVKAGRHAEAKRLLAVYDAKDFASVAPSKSQQAAEDAKRKYEALDKQIEDSKRFLNDMAGRTTEREPWKEAVKVILDELTYDTSPRLETFLGFAEQYQGEIKDKKKTTQTPEQVLALAISGWLQGNNAADPDAQAAERLFKARQAILAYLKTDNPAAREKVWKNFSARNQIAPDVLVRLIRMLPPVDPYKEKIEDKAVALDIEAPETNGGSYHVWTPLEYSPYRSYPVVVLLHSNREKPLAMLQRWQEVAARHGFILAAPAWGQGLKPTYGYTAKEHEVVLDTLRDLRRRFNVDSDRVFLFGWEQGANAALDIGLAHPDQFAGVLPMCGSTKGYVQKCWSNAQYLPMYVVEGDRNGSQPKHTFDVFKDWMRGHYPALYIEYKGRASEWYHGELTPMMDWMQRKKRHHPTKEMGLVGVGLTVGEEFKTLRATDNRFYWLSTSDIDARHLNDVGHWVPTIQPATLQANMSVGNDTDSKGKARVWTTATIRTRGVRDVTLRISPNMHDFSRPLTVRFNTQLVQNMRMVEPDVMLMLEELYTSGDRQTLVLAKLTFRV